MLEFSNGVQVEFERLKNSSDGAVLIAAVQGQNLLLIREYSCGLERYELGFAKGKIDPGETWQQAAIRESQEELGFLPQTLELLDEVSLAAGYMSHQTHIVFADDLIESPMPGDEPEPLEVIYWPLAEWPALLAHPEFSEGRAYAALMLVLKRLGKIG